MDLLAALAWTGFKHYFANDDLYNFAENLEPHLYGAAEAAAEELGRRLDRHPGPAAGACAPQHAADDAGGQQQGTWALLALCFLLVVAALVVTAFLAGAAAGAATTWWCMRRRQRAYRSTSRAQRLDAVAAYVRQGGAGAVLAVATDLGAAPHEVASWAVSWERALEGPGRQH